MHYEQNYPSASSPVTTLIPEELHCAGEVNTENQSGKKWQRFAGTVRSWVVQEVSSRYFSDMETVDVVNEMETNAYVWDIYEWYQNHCSVELN